MRLNNSNIAVIMSVYKNDKLDHITEAINSVYYQEDIIPLILVYVDGEIPQQNFSYLKSLHDKKIINLIYSKINKGLSFALKTYPKRNCQIIHNDNL